MANKHDYTDDVLMFKSEQEVVNQYVGKLRHLVANMCKWVQKRRTQSLTETALQWHNDNNDDDRKKRCIYLEK